MPGIFKNLVNGTLFRGLILKKFIYVAFLLTAGAVATLFRLRREISIFLPFRSVIAYCFFKSTFEI